MRVAVIGLGLIGASMARALAGKARVTGIDRDENVVRMAVEDGVIDTGSVEVSAVRGSEVVVLALPVGNIVPVASTAIDHLDPGAVLTDTGSTKAHIVEHMERLYGSFVGAHPIAGKEKPGYSSSDPLLFQEAVTIITPTASTPKGCIEKIAKLWEACGAWTCTMDPATHDRLMAKISHLPHLLSYASMSLAEDLHIHRELLGAGFRDFTRIAASDPVMWRDIFSDNRDNLLPLVDQYIGELLRLRSLIERGMTAELEDALARYARIRRELYDRSR